MGISVGTIVGSGEGDSVGAAVGSGEGDSVGAAVGSGEGDSVGAAVGSGEGVSVGVAVGSGEGVSVGATVGSGEGVSVGATVGSGEGVSVGSTVGASVGKTDNDGRRPHMAKRRKQGDFVGRRVVQVNPAGVERQVFMIHSVRHGNGARRIQIPTDEAIAFACAAGSGRGIGRDGATVRGATVSAHCVS